MDHEYAAFHGMALNRAHPVSERLELALRACELYETELKRLTQERDELLLSLTELAKVPGPPEWEVIKAAKAWRDWRREWITSQTDWSDEHVQPVVRDLARTVDALEGS